MAASDRRELVDRGALERAVAPDLGDHEGGDARVVELPGHLEEVPPRPLDPSVHGDVAAAGVEPDGHPAGVAGGEAPHPRGVLQGRRPDDHTPHAGVEQRVGGGVVAHAPTRLHGHVDGGGDGGHDRPVAGVAGAGGVEVDHVDPRRPGGGERPGLGDGVVAVHGLLPVVALVEAHAPPVAQVDRRVEVEAVHHAASAAAVARPTKLRRMASPVRLDFSGWNWVAHSASRSTAATTGPP